MPTIFFKLHIQQKYDRDIKSRDVLLQILKNNAKLLKITFSEFSSCCSGKTVPIHIWSVTSGKRCPEGRHRFIMIQRQSIMSPFPVPLHCQIHLHSPSVELDDLVNLFLEWRDVLKKRIDQVTLWCVHAECGGSSKNALAVSVWLLPLLLCSY